MTFGDVLILTGRCILYPTVFVAFFVPSSYVSRRTVNKFYCVSEVLLGIGYSASADFVMGTICSALGVWFYWLWKNGKDDDDDDKRNRRRKRRALLSKLSKVIPKPKTAPPLPVPAYVQNVFSAVK